MILAWGTVFQKTAPVKADIPRLPSAITGMRE